MTSSLLLLLVLASSWSQQDLKCLASVVHHEARGEPLAGQVQVAKVVINRASSKHYPSTVCEVSFQKDQFTDLKEVKYTLKDYIVAAGVYSGRLKAKFPRAMYYHTVDVKPYWSDWDKIKQVGIINHHVFYRLKDA